MSKTFDKGEFVTMPRQTSPKLDVGILEMAVRGYEAERDRINDAIAAIQAKLGQQSTGLSKTGPGTNHTTLKKRTMSLSARARIAAAQKARWQAYKKTNAEPAAPKKHKLSAAGRRAIQLATKKRWAEFHKAQKQVAKAKTRPQPQAAAKKAAVQEVAVTAAG
jgi:hypothetical protein